MAWLAQWSTCPLKGYYKGAKINNSKGSYCGRLMYKNTENNFQIEKDKIHVDEAAIINAGSWRTVNGKQWNVFGSRVELLPNLAHSLQLKLSVSQN